MDPNAAQRRIDEAKRVGNKREEREARRDLREWQARGGFAPRKR